MARPRGSDGEGTVLGGLIDGVTARLNALSEEQRWQALVAAVLELSDDPTVDDLLRHLTQVAAELVGARYAALGVLDGSGSRRLRTFVTHGVDEATQQAIGRRPRGHGLLGHLIAGGDVLRLEEISEHPASLGFPPGHPPMRTLLGVPIRIRGEVFGNLYLSEKVDGSGFTEGDARLLEALGDAAGVAIGNARERRDAVRRERWLTAAAELTARVLRPDLEGDPVQVVADRARELAGADAAWVVAGPDAEHLSVRAVSGMPTDASSLPGLDLSSSIAGRVVRLGAPVVVEDLSLDERAVDVSAELGWAPLGQAVVVPLRSSSGIEGTLAVAWCRDREEQPDELDASLPSLFAEQAALALHVARARRGMERLALLEERDRIARDLHDLVIQRLFAVGLSLQETLRLGTDAPVSTRLDQAITDLDLTIGDIRRAIFGLGSGRRGNDLRSGVEEVVERAATTLKFRPQLRVAGPIGLTVADDVAADVLAVLTEALSNVARHAHSSVCTVELDVTEGVRLRVLDDGVGMPTEVRCESGLANMRRRAATHGGRLRVRAPEAGGTEVDWWVPGGTGRPE